MFTGEHSPVATKNILLGFNFKVCKMGQKKAISLLKYFSVSDILLDLSSRHAPDTHVLHCYTE